MMELRNGQIEGATAARAEYNARELVGEGTTATITLDGQYYTLRITRTGKLILTK